MRKKHKLAVLALCAFVSANVAAQDSKLTFGVNAGMNVSNSSWSVGDLDKKAVIGFQVGGTVDYALTEEFYLQSGLSFTTKGAKVKGSGTIDGYYFEGSLKVNQSYLQVPIMGAYKLEVAPDTKIVFSAGPYLAVGVGGKSKLKGRLTIGGDAGYDADEKVDTFGDDGMLNRFDFGLGAGVAAEFGQIVVGLRYELGLTDIGKDDLSYRNRSASLTLGYKF